MTNIIYSGENSELFEQSYPYVYTGIRKTDEKIYIGARYAHINDKRSVKDDFGQHYFTSSEKVEFDEFDWEILYIGNNSKDSQDVFKFEAELINEHWGQPYLLNGHNPKSGKWNTAGMKGELSPLFGKRNTIEHNLNISNSQKGEKGYWFGKKQSDESNKKRKITMTGIKYSDDRRSKMRKPKSAEHKQKLRIPRPQQIVTCPHCGRTGGKSNMTRYHFDNCKNKPI